MCHQVVTRTLMLRLVLVLMVMGGAIAALPRTGSLSSGGSIQQLASRQVLSFHLMIW